MRETPGSAKTKLSPSAGLVAGDYHQSDEHFIQGEPARRAGTLCRMDPAEAEERIDLFGLWAEP